MKKILFALIILTSFLTCSKQDNSTPGNGTSATVDLIKLPLTTGTWWKYARVDYSVLYIAPAAVTTKIDSSQEIITVIGKAQFITGRPVYIWQIQNITHNTLDTNYVFYSSDSMQLYYSGNIKALFPFPYFATSLQVNNSPFSLTTLLSSAPLSLDTVFYRTDTSLNINGKAYNHTLYFNHTYFCTSFAPSGAGCSYNVNSYFIGPGIGILSSYSYSKTGGSFASSTSTSTRQLIDYKIAP